LFSYLDERRMLGAKLHVTGPRYAHIAVQLLIARNSDAVDQNLTDTISDSLKRFLNPLPSDDGNGWPFGRDVFVSGIYEILEKIEGIDFIADVMLSSACPPGDDNCIVANSVWHAEGDLVGLAIEDHHLPVFDHADIVIAPNTAFVIVNLTVSGKVSVGADFGFLKRSIKSATRNFLSPSIAGPAPTTTLPTDIFASDLAVAIKKIPGLLDPLTVLFGCVPSDILRTDKDRGAFIHVDAGKVIDWRVSIRLS
jgi:hypothetical protein